jgi:hypothetical protein
LLTDRHSTTRFFIALPLCIASLNVINPDIITHRSSGKRLVLNIHGGRLEKSWRERMDMAELQGKIHTEADKAGDGR